MNTDTCVDCSAPLTDTDAWLCQTCMRARDDAEWSAPDNQRCETCGMVMPYAECILCDTCTAQAYWDADPYGFGAWRDHQLEHQSASRYVAGILLLATLLAGLILYAGWQDVQADETSALVAPRPINGRVYQWPAIGTPAFSRSCRITMAWEDFSATAYCREDGTSWVYDADGSPEITGRTRIPQRQPGWYVVVNNA